MHLSTRPLGCSSVCVWSALLNHSCPWSGLDMSKRRLLSLFLSQSGNPFPWNFLEYLDALRLLITEQAETYTLCFIQLHFLTYQQRDDSHPSSLSYPNYTLILQLLFSCSSIQLRSLHAHQLTQTTPQSTFNQIGFFPVAQAAEKCVLSGVAQTPSITAEGLNGLCRSYTGYVQADKQTPPADLAPAVASASALAAALPTATGGAGDGSGSKGSGASGSYRMADGSSSVVMVGMTAFAAVVLATAAAF